MIYEVINDEEKFRKVFRNRIFIFVLGVLVSGVMVFMRQLIFLLMMLHMIIVQVVLKVQMYKGRLMNFIIHVKNRLQVEMEYWIKNRL